MCAGKPRIPPLKAGLQDFYPFLDHGLVTFSGNNHLAIKICDKIL